MDTDAYWKGWTDALDTTKAAVDRARFEAITGADEALVARIGDAGAAVRSLLDTAEHSTTSQVVKHAESLCANHPEIISEVVTFLAIMATKWRPDLQSSTAPPQARPEHLHGTS